MTAALWILMAMHLATIVALFLANKSIRREISLFRAELNEWRAELDRWWAERDADNVDAGRLQS